MPKLKTEMHTPEMEERILCAADSHDLTACHSTAKTADFEHGQWWVTCLPCGAQWSVVDEEPGVDGLGFERVTNGDGACEEG
jgi:hypothetical protein